MGIGVLFIYFRFNPDENPFPRCPFLSLTGLFCPGCGSQRAIHALLHGDLSTTLAYNPLVIFVSLILLYQGALKGLKALGRKIHDPIFYAPATPWLIAVAVVLFGILRNLPMAPFDAWAPGP